MRCTLHIAWLWLVVFVALATAASAQTALPPLATCVDEEAARYERVLARFDRTDVGRDFDIADVRGVDFCGTVGIVRCDRSLDFFGCQRALRLEQDLLRHQILVSLPSPPDVAAVAESAAGETVAEAWALGFYPQAWALAQGSSAGPDCAGELPIRQVWCEAREANRRLANAVLAWQVARFLGAADSAVAEGWARHPPAVRPQMRPAGLR